MSFTKELRSWFFRPTALVNTEGKKINLQDGSRPDQDVFEKLTASHPNFKESADRAKLSTGAAIELEVGIVAVNADADVLTYTNGLLADRTLVPTAKNLTEVATTGTNDTISVVNGSALYDDTAITIGKDGTETKRNKFFPQLKASFTTWIEVNILPRLLRSGGTAGQVLEKIDGTNYNTQWVTPATAAVDIYEPFRTVSATITFDGTIGGGANGNVVPIPENPVVNTGEFIYETFYRITSTLTYTSAPLLFVGIATDAPGSALDGTTGLVSTMNATPILKLDGADYIKSTIDGRFMEIDIAGTGDVTGGTVEFIFTIARANFI